MDWKRLGRITLTTFEWIGVVVFGLILLAVVTIFGVLAWLGDPPERFGHEGEASGKEEAAVVEPRPAPTPVEAKSLFAPIHRVLVSPRCMNCHPDGDRPLAADGGVHPQNISRTSADSGLLCSTCHGEHNSRVPGGPPGAPHWGLPPADTPMIFEGRSVTELCRQLRDVRHNGERTLAQILEHTEKDPLVLWGWDPGGDRTPPPGSHEEFVASVAAWVEAGGICPGETEPPVLGEEAGEERETTESSAAEGATPS